MSISKIYKIHDVLIILAVFCGLAFTKAANVLGFTGTESKNLNAWMKLSFSLYLTFCLKKMFQRTTPSVTICRAF